MNMASIEAIAGIGNRFFILKVRNRFYAVVDVEEKKIVRTGNYWLNIAKYEPVFDISLQSRELADHAIEVFRRSGFDLAEAESGIGELRSALEEGQERLLEESRKTGRGIYL